MATNEVFRNADNISLPVATGTLAGVAVIAGGLDGLVGVTQTAEAGGGNAAGFASCMLKGSHRLAVAGAITAIGTPVYIPTTGGALTTTATANALFGHALELKAAGTSTINVRVARK